MPSPKSLRLALLAPLLAFAGCGCSQEEPAPDPGGDPGGATARPEDPDRRPPEAGKPVLGGTVELAGELARVERGALFLVARDASTNMSALVKKVELSAGGRAAGEPVEFVLTDGDMMLPVPVPEAMLLKVSYDPDGLAETREGTVTTVLEVRAGDLGVRARLGGDEEQGG